MTKWEQYVAEPPCDNPSTVASMRARDIRDLSERANRYLSHPERDIRVMAIVTQEWCEAQLK